MVVIEPPYADTLLVKYYRAHEICREGKQGHAPTSPFREYYEHAKAHLTHAEACSIWNYNYIWPPYPAAGVLEDGQCHLPPDGGTDD